MADKGTFVGKKAELVFTDGTSKVVTTEKDYSKADNLKYDVNKDGKFTEADNTAWSTTAGVADGQKEPVIVTYKVDNDGVYTLKAVDTAKSSYKVASTALNRRTTRPASLLTSAPSTMLRIPPMSLPTALHSSWLPMPEQRGLYRLHRHQERSHHCSW